MSDRFEEIEFIRKHIRSGGSDAKQEMAIFIDSLCDLIEMLREDVADLNKRIASLERRRCGGPPS